MARISPHGNEKRREQAAAPIPCAAPPEELPRFVAVLPPPPNDRGKCGPAAAHEAMRCSAHRGECLAARLAARSAREWRAGQACGQERVTGANLAGKSGPYDSAAVGGRCCETVRGQLRARWVRPGAPGGRTPAGQRHSPGGPTGLIILFFFCPRAIIGQRSTGADKSDDGEREETRYAFALSLAAPRTRRSWQRHRESEKRRKKIARSRWS